VSIQTIVGVSYDVTVTVIRDDGYCPDPAESAVASRASRTASVVSAHIADEIISIATVETADRFAAVAVALAVVSEVSKRPAASPKPLSGRLRHYKSQGVSYACPVKCS
jgi:hypothetical protein